MGSGTTGTKETDIKETGTKETGTKEPRSSSSSEIDSKATAEIEAIRSSRRSTPGAFHIVPTYNHNHNSDGNSTERSGNYTDGDDEQVDSSEPLSGTATTEVVSTPATASTTVKQELTEAWVVPDGASASNTEESNPNPIVAVTATPLKERRWFLTSGGIVSIMLVAVIMALAVAIPLSQRQQEDTGPTRPYDIVVPTMPQGVSDMLEVKYNKLRSGNPITMAFSADLTIHASTLVDHFYGQLQICKYDANTAAWVTVDELDEEEARKIEFMHQQTGLSAGDRFGSWADMSYDGNILAIGLPADDPMDIIDAGSVLVLKLSPEDETENNNNENNFEPLNLEAQGNYIMGEDPYGWTGSTFSFTADGSMIAVTSPNGSRNRGNVRVYKFEQDESIIYGGVWIQIGQDIIGDEVGEGLSMVKLSEDGSILAAGSYMYGQDNGQIKFFQWDASTNLWVQKGSTIVGENKVRLGFFPHFSRDGQVVAFSQVNTHKSTQCHVYQWEEETQDWINMDRGTPDSYVCMDLSPDGKKLILCSPTLQDCILQKFVGDEWVEEQRFLEVDGFLPYTFERVGNGEQIAGLARAGTKEGGNGYTIAFYSINS